MADDSLSPEEVALLRAFIADVRAGRRLACLVWKALAIVGGIAVASTAVLANIHWFWPTR